VKVDCFFLPAHFPSTFYTLLNFAYLLISLLLHFSHLLSLFLKKSDSLLVLVDQMLFLAFHIFLLGQ
jgi:hypothetical protein